MAHSVSQYLDSPHVVGLNVRIQLCQGDGSVAEVEGTESRQARSHTFQDASLQQGLDTRHGKVFVAADLLEVIVDKTFDSGLDLQFDLVDIVRIGSHLFHSCRLAGLQSLMRQAVIAMLKERSKKCRTPGKRKTC